VAVEVDEDIHPLPEGEHSFDLSQVRDFVRVNIHQFEESNPQFFNSGILQPPAKIRWSGVAGRIEILKSKAVLPDWYQGKGTHFVSMRLVDLRIQRDGDDSSAIVRQISMVGVLAGPWRRR